MPRTEFRCPTRKKDDGPLLDTLFRVSDQKGRGPALVVTGKASGPVQKRTGPACKVRGSS